MVVRDNPGDIAANGEDDFPEALLGDFDVSRVSTRDDYNGYDGYDGYDEEGKDYARSI